MGVTVLERPVYSEAEASRILQVSQATLHWWLDGGTRRGKTYPPVIREQATQSREVTWGEFIEAGLLRQYRREQGVDLAEIRAFIDLLRSKTGAPYPLAHYQPWVGEDNRLILEAQEASSLPTELWLVAPTDGQQVIRLAPAEAFLSRIEWNQEEDRPETWRPHSDENSPVRCNPLRRYGRPTVGATSTEVIVEHLDAGETEHEVAEQFNIEVQDVQWARAYELSSASLAA